MMSDNENEVKEALPIKLDPKAIIRAEWIAERDEILKEIAAVEVVDSDDKLKVGGKLQTKASKHVKALDKIRLAVNKPANDYVKDMNAQAKELAETLVEETARLKKINSDYATKKNEDAEAELKRIADAQAETDRKALEESQRLAASKPPVTFGGVPVCDLANSEAAQPAQPELPVIPIPSGKVHTGANAMVTVWDFTILDAAKVPREFLTVDEKKIRAHVKYKKDMGEDPKIDGVRFDKRVDCRSR